MLRKNLKSKNKRDDELTLLERYNEEIKKKDLDKDNLTLLQKAIMEGNEYKKIQKKKKIIPAKVDTEIKVELELAAPYDDKFEKYLHYAEKYRIPFTKGGIKKSYKELAQEIHKYEMKNLKHILNSGLDKKYKEYGHYINVV